MGKKRKAQETLQTIGRITINECGEPLVPARIYCPKLRYVQMAARVPRARFVRRTVACMIGIAQSFLPRGFRLGLAAGFRMPEDRKFLLRAYTSNIRKSYPHWEETRILQEAEKHLPPIRSVVPMPHWTGAAVDLVLLSERGAQLSMASSSKKVSTVIAKRRRLFFLALSQAGLTNFKPEWWHWSWGDSGWAWRGGQATAHYGNASTIRRAKK